MAQEAHERAAAILHGQDHQRKLRRLAGKRTAIEAQIAALRAEVDSDTAEVDFAVAEQALRDQDRHRDTKAIFQRRSGVTGENDPAMEKQ